MPKKDQEYDLDRLKSLSETISAHSGAHDKTGLLDMLKSVEKLRLTEKPKGSGIYTATMAGIAAQSTSGYVAALNNWANRARRILKDAG